MNAEINDLLKLLKENMPACALTGAGISTDCGVPDYRSQGGLWDKYQPVTYQEFLSSEDSRQEYWRRKKEVYPAIRGAVPGPVHTNLKQMEELGMLKGIVTQNIDGLHTRAGSRNVIELHGTTLEVICLDCQKVTPFETVLPLLKDNAPAPRCTECEGLLKPNTISFGQSLKTETLHQAVDLVQRSALLFCIGSSLVVEPAASLPRYARRAGAKVVVINREPTPVDSQADQVIRTELGPFFADLKGLLRAWPCGASVL